jgi:hypothetical protein
MKLPNNLGLKGYTILFAIFAMGTLTSLTTPDGGTYIYYNTLLRFHPPSILWYILGLLDAILGCLAVIPLILRAWNRPPVVIQLFQLFFMLRIVMIFFGHNYEWLVIKSAFLGTPIIGWLTLGIWALFVFPSFKEHFIYAFRSK